MDRPSVGCRGRSHQKIRQLQELHFVRSNGLNSLDDVAREIEDVAGQDFMELPDLCCAPGILDIQIDPKAVSRLQDQLQHVEIHLVIPVVMSLLEVRMSQARLIGDQAAEGKLIAIEEIVQNVSIELKLARRDFGPFDLE